ncbi:MAG: signal recognition particle receptor subunit alpha, partial [Rhizomicrobium sp.]
MRTFGEAPPEETGLLARFKAGLAKSSASLSGSLSGLFTRKKLDAEAIARLEEVLIGADMGVSQARRFSEAVARNRYDSEIADAELRAILAKEIAVALAPLEGPLLIDGGKKPFVILVAGVNGTGKT